MRQPELPGLTGIRFYAALLVYLSHVVEVIPGMTAIGGSFLIFNVGVVGVAFFFVLSGFILTYNYADAFSQGVSTRNYRTFVWTRLTKIYPVYLLTLTMGMSMALLSSHGAVDWRAIILHVFLLQNWWPSNEPAFFGYFNGPAWALSCEWFFYLVAPLAIFALVSAKHRWVPLGVTVGYVAVLCAVLSAGQPDAIRLHWVSWFAPSRLLEFLAGMYLARFFLASPRATLTRYSTLMQLVGILLIAGGAIYRPVAPWPLWGGWLYLPGSLLLILGLSYGQGSLVAHLSHPWLNRLGVASFALYLVHVPLLRVAKGVSSSLFQWEVQSWGAFWLIAVGLFLVIQTCALLLCFLFEIPLQQRLRALTPKWESAPSRNMATKYSA